MEQNVCLILTLALVLHLLYYRLGSQAQTLILGKSGPHLCQVRNTIPIRCRCPRAGDGYDIECQCNNDETGRNTKRSIDFKEASEFSVRLLRNRIRKFEIMDCPDLQLEPNFLDNAIEMNFFTLKNIAKLLLNRKAFQRDSPRNDTKIFIERVQNLTLDTGPIFSGSGLSEVSIRDSVTSSSNPFPSKTFSALNVDKISIRNNTLLGNMEREIISDEVTTNEILFEGNKILSEVQGGLVMKANIRKIVNFTSNYFSEGIQNLDLSGLETTTDTAKFVFLNNSLLGLEAKSSLQDNGLRLSRSFMENPAKQLEIRNLFTGKTCTCNEVDNEGVINVSGNSTTVKEYLGKVLDSQLLCKNSAGSLERLEVYQESGRCLLDDNYDYSRNICGHPACTCQNNEVECICTTRNEEDEHTSTILIGPFNSRKKVQRYGFPNNVQVFSAKHCAMVAMISSEMSKLSSVNISHVERLRITSEDFISSDDNTTRGQSGLTFEVRNTMFDTSLQSNTFRGLNFDKLHFHSCVMKNIYDQAFADISAATIVFENLTVVSQISRKAFHKVECQTFELKNSHIEHLHSGAFDITVNDKIDIVNVTFGDIQPHAIDGITSNLRLKNNKMRFQLKDIKVRNFSPGALALHHSFTEQGRLVTKNISIESKCTCSLHNIADEDHDHADLSLEPILSDLNCENDSTSYISWERYHKNNCMQEHGHISYDGSKLTITSVGLYIGTAILVSVLLIGSLVCVVCWKTRKPIVPVLPIENDDDNWSRINFERIMLHPDQPFRSFSSPHANSVENRDNETDIKDHTYYNTDPRNFRVCYTVTESPVDEVQLHETGVSQGLSSLDIVQDISGGSKRSTFQHQTRE